MKHYRIAVREDGKDTVHYSDNCRDFNDDRFLLRVALTPVVSRHCGSNRLGALEICDLSLKKMHNGQVRFQVDNVSFFAEVVDIEKDVAYVEGGGDA